LELLEISKVTNAGVDELQVLTNLVALKLCNSLDISNLAALNTMKFLKNLSLRGSSVDNEQIKLLVEQHPVLRKLSLSEVGTITEDAVRHVATLRELTELNLSFTVGIGDTSLPHLAKMTQLEVLSLQACTSIGDVNLLQLTALRRLELLVLLNTSCSLGMIERLRKRLLDTCMKIETDDGIVRYSQRPIYL